MNELESLKPEFQCRVEELNRDFARMHLPQLDGPERISYGSESSSSEFPPVNKIAYSNINVKRVFTIVNKGIVNAIIGF